MTSPAKGPDYRDTVSSGASYYSNPYREDPGFRQAQRVTVDPSRRMDSIQSERQRLEKDIQNQFQNNLRLPPGAIVLAVQVGRFIVLAIILPPYYVIYKGPQLVFEQLKPFILEGMEKGGQLLKLIQSFIILNLKNLFNLTVQKPSKRIQHLFKKLMRPKTDSKEHRLVDRPVNILKAIIKPFQMLAGVLAKTIADLQLKSREFGQNFVRQIKHFYPTVKNFVKEKMGHVQNAIQEKLKTFIPIAQKLNAVANAAINATLKKSQEVFQNTVAVPARAVYQFIQNTVVQKLLKPLQTFIQKTIQTQVIAPFKKAVSAVSEPLKHAVKYVSERIESVKDRAVVHLQSFVKAASIPMTLLFNLSAKGLPLLQSNLKQFIVPARHVAATFKRISNTLKRGVLRVSDMTKNYLKEKMASLKKWGSKGKEIVVKGASIVIQKVKQIPARLFQKLKQFFFWLKGVFAKILKSLRIAFIWVKILVRYNFRQRINTLTNKK